jgi:hypothetical protein
MLVSSRRTWQSAAIWDDVKLFSSTSFTFPDINVGGTWSVSIWAKGLNDTPYASFSAYLTQTLPVPLNISLYATSNNSISGGFFNNGQFYLGGAVSTPKNTWRNIVYTWGSTSGIPYITLYVDGVQVSQTRIDSVSSKSGGGRYRIGAGWDNPSNVFIYAEIGHILIYKRAITEAEVTQIYNSTKGFYRNV